MRWIQQFVIKLVHLILDITFPVIVQVPGLAYMFKNAILSEYLRLSFKFAQPTDETYQVTALVELTVRPWDSLRNLRDRLAPYLQAPAV